jgi:RNA-directed DNA polymerase
LEGDIKGCFDNINHIDNGFDFLGWNFRKYNGKLLIKPSKKSVDALAMG